MKIIVAFDSFKGSLSAEDACEIAAKTISKHIPAAVIIKPMADGGEGTAKIVMTCCSGIWQSCTAVGPLPEMQVESGFVWLENKHTAMVETASASGIALLGKEQLNPLKTTTYGTGQLIKKAIEKQPAEILLAVGGSATVDMGVGAAMALGWQFLDRNNKSVGLGGECLERIVEIVPSETPIDCRVKVLSDVSNPLYGKNGAAEVFAPQKGATPDMVKRLEAAIRRLSDLVESRFGRKIADISGAGAAGGLGAGAAAFMNAEIVSGIEAVIDIANLKYELSDADWIITGEGRFDSQSLNGKVVSGIINAARQTNAKVAVIAGDVQLSRAEYEKFGVSCAIGLKKNNMTTEYAMNNSRKLLIDAVESFSLLLR
jgi:glycerate 2-kinase